MITILREKVLSNTDKTINKLGVDFINFRPNFEIVKKMMLESFIRRGDFLLALSCWDKRTSYKYSNRKKYTSCFYGEPSAEYSSFYNYEDIEELNVEKFNKTTNLGINAEDMLEMINDRYADKKISIKELKPFIFPSQREINKNNIKAVYLGNYIPWDVKKQVEIIKELDWEGDTVEGIPPEYDYEKNRMYDARCKRLY